MSGPSAAGAQDLAVKIEAFLKPFVEANNFIGVVYVSRGDRVLFQKGYGPADREWNVPNTPETRFHIASAIEAIVAGETPLSEPAAPIAPKAGELAALAGRYQMPEDYYVPGVILALEDRGQYLEAHWGNSASTIIFPVAEGRYFDRSYWARVSFTRVDGGKVAGLIYSLGRDFKARRIS